MTSAMNLKNCGSVLVTGASRGLGLQIVHSLASGGFSPGKIIATARNPVNTQVTDVIININGRVLVRVLVLIYYPLAIFRAFNH